MVKAVRVLVGAELLAAAVAGHAYSPGSGLSGTPHDWSTGDGTTVLLWKDRQGGATTYNTGTPWIDPATGRQGTTRIANGQCTTCHTPQQAGSSTLLWNYTLQPVGYRWNDPATTAGTRYPVFQGDTYNDVGSGNIVAGVVPGRTGNECSSCHDAHNGSQVRTRWEDGIAAVAATSAISATSNSRNCVHAEGAGPPAEARQDPLYDNAMRHCLTYLATADL